MSTEAALDEDVPAGPRRLPWRKILLWTLIGLLAVLAAMTVIGLVGSVHITGGAPHRPPAPAP